MGRRLSPPSPRLMGMRGFLSSAGVASSVALGSSTTSALWFATARCVRISWISYRLR